MFGWLEFAIIALVLLVLFGGTRLPGIARGLGKSIKNFKHALRGDDGIQVQPAAPDGDPSPHPEGNQKETPTQTPPEETQ